MRKEKTKNAEISEPSPVSDREHFLLAKAVHIARKALKMDPNPPMGDIADLDALAVKHFKSHNVLFEFEDDMQLALSAGYKPPKGSNTMLDVKRWLAMNLPPQKRH